MESAFETNDQTSVDSNATYGSQFGCDKCGEHSCNLGQDSEQSEQYIFVCASTRAAGKTVIFIWIWLVLAIDKAKAFRQVEMPELIYPS